MAIRLRLKCLIFCLFGFIFLYLSWQTDQGNPKPDRGFKIFTPISQTPGYSWLSDLNLSRQGNVYLEQYKLHYCKIDKNMGSVVQAVLCFIDNSTKYEKLFLNETWQPGMSGTECGISTSYGDLRKRFLKAISRNFFGKRNGVEHFAIIRHPINRFVSAWLNVCSNKPFRAAYCFDCKEDLTCFIMNNYWHIRKHALKQNPTKWAREHHFYPQSWYCDFKSHLDYYKLLDYHRTSDRDGSFLVDFLEIFYQQNVPTDLIKTVSEVLSHKSTKHQTYERNDALSEQIYNNPLLLDVIVKTYYSDFKMFDYEI